MRTRFSEKIDKVQARVLDGPGRLLAARRRLAFEGRPLGDDLADAFVGNIHRHAYEITGDDVEALRRAGWSEDQIYELSVAAAFGAARHRLDAGLRALGAARSACQVPADEGV